MRDFNHTVSVLVKAFFEDTLVHGNCYACAVGNIVADSIGTKCVKVKTEHHSISWENGEPYPAFTGNQLTAGWGSVFSTSEDEDQDSYEMVKHQSIDLEVLNQSPRANLHIKSTGYTWEELAKIEWAFENVKGKKTKKMFNGLMAVVDVLADIHGIDLKAKEEAKALFVKAGV